MSVCERVYKSWVGPWLGAAHRKAYCVTKNVVSVVNIFDGIEIFIVERLIQP